LIKFLAEAHRGIHGFVMDEHGNPVEKASLKMKSRDVGFQSTKYGEFWRILMPGMYKLEVYADGYVPREVDVMVVDQHPTLVNVTLHAAKVRVKFSRGPRLNANRLVVLVGQRLLVSVPYMHKDID
jgi:carboxypeptidase M